jgi:hypothetical protein
MTTIANYYLDEQEEWKTNLDIRLHTITEALDWLKKVIQSNTVPKLAAITEHFINQLDISQISFLQLRNDIEVLEKKMHINGIPIENEAVQDDHKKSQQEIRTTLHELEKEYLDSQFECGEFLAGTIAAQMNGRKNNF